MVYWNSLLLMLLVAASGRVSPVYSCLETKGWVGPVEDAPAQLNLVGSFNLTRENLTWLAEQLWKPSPALVSGGCRPDGDVPRFLPEFFERCPHFADASAVCPERRFLMAFPGEIPAYHLAAECEKSHWESGNCRGTCEPHVLWFPSAVRLADGRVDLKIRLVPVRCRARAMKSGCNQFMG